MNEPNMNVQAITVNAAILAIWTAAGLVLSLYAWKKKKKKHKRVYYSDYYNRTFFFFPPHNR